MARPLANKAFAVGVLAAVCGAAFLIAFTFFRKGGYSERDSYLVHAYYDDATGLSWKSRVQIAGIQIGEIAEIKLEAGRARLNIRIRKDIDVRADACLTKRFPSTLLPDALLDLAPGSARSASLRELPEDQREIKCAMEAVTVAKLLSSLSRVSEDVEKITSELSSMVAGSEGSIKQIIGNLEKISANINETVESGSTKVSAILDNTQSFTGTLAGVASADRERYHAITRNIESASARLDQVLQSVQDLLGDEGEGGGGGAGGAAGKGGVRASIADARQSLQRLNNTMEQLEKVANNIAQGKGVAGKLLADERLGEKLGNTLESASDYYDKLFKLQLKVNLRSEWQLNQTGSKTYAGFTLLPRPDKYYIFEIVSDPRGVQTQTVEQIATPTGTVSTTKTVTEQKVSFSLEFAKRFGPAAFRIGIIESSGGAGADLYLLKDSLKLSVSVFQFARPEPAPKFPRAKLWVDYTFLHYLYATVGTDDFLNTWRAGRFPGGPKFAIGNDVFFGGGIVFTDEDLKSLIGAAGSSLSGGATSTR
jgi:phospholipid/cholesterol/gamma-HCH transport system substrate-binding protein